MIIAILGIAIQIAVIAADEPFQGIFVGKLFLDL